MKWNNIKWNKIKNSYRQCCFSLDSSVQVGSSLLPGLSVAPIRVLGWQFYYLNKSPNKYNESHYKHMIQNLKWLTVIFHECTVVPPHGIHCQTPPEDAWNCRQNQPQIYYPIHNIPMIKFNLKIRCSKRLK